MGRQAYCLYIQTLLVGETPNPLLGCAKVKSFYEKQHFKNERREVMTTNKSKVFCFRLSESDFLRIQNKADKAKLSMSAFILTNALDKKIIVINGLENFISELKAIGKNINQLTTLCNMGKIQALELAEIKRQFGAMVESVTNFKAG